MRNINDYLLIKHTPNGRVFPYLDCWGLIVDIYRENLGIELNEYTTLSHANMARGLMYERQAGHFTEVTEPQDYDIVAFFVAGRLYHVGVLVGGRLLHTSERKNCRWERLDGAALAHKRYYRYVNN